MPEVRRKPVASGSDRLHDEVEVGEDLVFQRKWWRFERVAWVVFTLIVLLDLSGALGQGPLAHAHCETADGAIRVHYERVERSLAPSVLTVEFGPGAIDHGEAHLFVGDSVVRALGAERVIPQPVTTATGDGRLDYTFRADGTSAVVQFALEPARPGWVVLGVQGAHTERLDLHIAVLP